MRQKISHLTGLPGAPHEEKGVNRTLFSRVRDPQAHFPSEPTHGYS